MKGLKEYIAKHGRHFTEALAMNVINSRWSPSEIEKSSDAMVYYNVSEATLGDMVFLANHYSKVHCHATKRKCVRYAIGVVGNVNANGYAFSLWLMTGGNIDLQDFI